LLRIIIKEEEAGDFPEEESEEEAKEAEVFLPVSPYFNTPECFYCGNLGHIQRACQLKPVTSAVEVRNYRERPPRPHSQ